MEPSREVDDLARAVIGGAIEVHRDLGPGYSESIYEEALAHELARSGIGFERQKSFRVNYRGRTVGEGRVDFLIAGKLVLELKAVERLLPVHKAQVISYLRATSCSLGLLINFNENLLRAGIQRIVFTFPTEPGLGISEQI
ncbi:MAG: GxxExxY protein [Betaproteobacteria bacterium]|nr:GxxExxY protein [Betaproteobacteria bacterium]